MEYTSQSRLDYNTERLLEMGIDRAYVTPFTTNNEALSDPEVILSNLELLADKAETAAKKGLKVYPLFVTINHPEGNYNIPGRYRVQSHIDGTLRPAFICFRDKVRQAEMIQYASKAAELGFERMAFDDDMRDAFCYCDEHLKGFVPFVGKSREDIEEILNGVLSHPEQEELRKQWYQYKYDGMCDYAGRLEQAIHSINPNCRIGIFNSAKRCQDFSGRDPVEWLKLFSTTQAPAFVRLCGECYDDDVTHLVQSTGWHHYFDRCFPQDTERMLEITSVPAISYRSAGHVILETKAVVAATDRDTVHWAWTEELDKTSLGDFIGPAKEELTSILNEISEPPSSPLALYIGSQLGPYTPINISASYGATHDPMTAYNIVSLIGLPVTVTPTIHDKQPSILCSGYISREMISNIEDYVHSGGVAFIDAKAAQCYKVYDGIADFSITGPVSLHRYELSPNGEREEIIAQCPHDSVHIIKTNTEWKCWTGYNIEGNVSGETTTIIPMGRGSLVVMGFDLSRANKVLICEEWRERILKMLELTGVSLPVYWKGPEAVQCMFHNDRVTLVNYNSHPVTGHLIATDTEYKDISTGPFENNIILL